MRQLKLFAILLGIPFILRSQVSAIHFEHTLNWKDVKVKAKSKNKLIFLDCFATWCGPCKQMDKEVYLNDSVAQYFNEKFISVKVQMDRTDKDNFQTKVWYKDANFISTRYRIEGFPTLIVLSPDGKLISKELGFKGPKDFLAFGKSATIPGKSYDDPNAKYNKLTMEYKNGKREYKKMPYIINKGNDLNDSELVRKVMNDYMDYLLSLKRDEIYTQVNIDLLSFQYKISSNSVFFKLFYPDGTRVDIIMNEKGYAQNVVDRAIRRELIYPNLNLQNITTEPEWKLIYEAIKQKYNSEYAERNLLGAKAYWYESNGDWQNYVKYFVPLVDNYGINCVKVYHSVFNNPTWSPTEKMLETLNFVAWEGIFSGSEDSNYILSAINWMEKAIEIADSSLGSKDRDYIDTYANLLFKYGKKDEAIFNEIKAIHAAKELHNTDEAMLFGINLDKMKKGIPTWEGLKPRDFIHPH